MYIHIIYNLAFYCREHYSVIIARAAAKWESYKQVYDSLDKVQQMRHMEQMAEQAEAELDQKRKQFEKDVTGICNNYMHQTGNITIYY